MRSAGRKFDLVLFDLDGTLADDVSSWQVVHRHFGVDNEENLGRFLRGEIDDFGFIRADVAMWTRKAGRVHEDVLRSVLARVPMMPGAGALLSTLRAAGTRTVIVSGGIDHLAARFVAELSMDGFVANRLSTDPAGFLTGEGEVRVPVKDKGTPTREIMRRFGVAKGRAAAVGNSVHDAPMFAEAGFGVAVAPLDDDVCKAADVVIAGKDLRDAIPHLV
ncbi:MAG: HAD-IB family phosphatase [Methanobacteriota archaeon]